MKVYVIHADLLHNNAVAIEEQFMGTALPNMEMSERSTSVGERARFFSATLRLVRGPTQPPQWVLRVHWPMKLTAQFQQALRSRVCLYIHTLIHHGIMPN
jgi:hypothetical protein